VARVRAFRRFQVNAVLPATARPDVLFLHCLLAHRSKEDGGRHRPSRSAVWDQAANRLHTERALVYARSSLNWHGTR
jgi:ornithine carbamoyltransferase